MPSYRFKFWPYKDYCVLPYSVPSLSSLNSSLISLHYSMHKHNSWSSPPSTAKTFSMSISVFLGGTSKSLPTSKKESLSSRRQSVDFVKWRAFFNCDWQKITRSSSSFAFRNVQTGITGVCVPSLLYLHWPVLGNNAAGKNIFGPSLKFFCLFKYPSLIRPFHISIVTFFTQI